MKNFLIVHGFAHRLSPMNIIESAPIKISGEIISFDAGLMMNRSPASMDLTGADLHEIHGQLSRINSLFYDDAARTPKSEEFQP